MSTLHQPIKLFETVVDQCPYLDDQQSASILVDPEHNVDTSLFALLSRSGFRRSGDMLYAPKCPDCKACISVRINVKDFKPSRGQRRVWKRNTDLHVKTEDIRFDQQHFDMYLKYQQSRHPESSMCDDDPNKYTKFMESYFSESFFLAIYLQGELIGLSVLDQFIDGLSAVYTFFDPDYSNRSLGTYAILAAIKHARISHISHVYLGYWVKDSQKMDYKSKFQPLEGYIDRNWQDIPLEK